MSEARTSLIIPATMINSLVTLAPQLVALTTLQSGDFGRFSIVYLLFAWGASLQMSVVCEPVGREQRRSDSGVADRDYRAVATYIALGAGSLAAVASQLLWHRPSVTLVLGVAGAAACFRVPARYASLLQGDWRGALRVDAAACVLLVIGGAAALLLERSAIEVVVWSWGAAMVGACVIGLSPVLVGPTVLLRWLRKRRRDIAPLTLDSLVQDISSIGAPYAIAPILGLANFGIYRAISNVAAPVRLLIEPLRPSWARVDALVLRHKLERASAFIAVPAGVMAALALEAVRFLPWELGVLDDLRPWSVAAGAFVTFSLVSLMFYAAARLQLGGRALWRGRIAQSSTAIVLPIAGALFGGLAGAIWCYVVATALGAVVWVVLTRPQDQGKPPRSV
jgi:hypothetical protein